MKASKEYQAVENTPSILSERTQEALTLIKPYEKLFTSPKAKHDAIKKGLEPKAIQDLIEIAGVTQTDAAHILDLTEPTLRKYIKTGKELNTGLSEHLLQLFELFDKGMDTFGSLEEFKNWLPHHNIGINAVPMELLDTLTGINMVKSELIRIDYGVTA
ncbi:MAG: antitoxin Xre/MbcA/ParS toxin-binding domain-containing protein [Mucilaginibacter sp.]|uniref:antitoxin Xre/MbcA/ParS toxin-binding domain-containing protein n=1 Tax=Mucilaginibacter sp. TaxID=1882438 RepID=UPI0034E54B60